jgi:hypothetical protein
VALSTKTHVCGCAAKQKQKRKGLCVFYCGFVAKMKIAGELIQLQNRMYKSICGTPQQKSIQELPHQIYVAILPQNKDRTKMHCHNSIDLNPK